MKKLSHRKTALLMHGAVFSCLRHGETPGAQRQLHLFPPSSEDGDAAELMTWDCKASPPGWLLLRDGRIEGLGEGAPPAALDFDMKVDLQGAHVGPAFADNHLHLIWLADAIRRISLRGSTSLEEALERIRMQVKSTESGWVRGGGWNKNLWPDDRFPTAADLDGAIAQRPAAFESQDLHSIWLNSKALHELGIDAHGPDDPEGGRVERDAQGRPTGLLREAAVKLATDRIPQAPDAHRLEALPQAYATLASKGITAVTDLDGLSGLELHRRVAERAPLPLRIASAVRKEELDLALRVGLRSGQVHGPCTIGPHKLFADGAFISQTALLLEPYLEGRRDLGIQATSTKELDEAIGRALAGGLCMAVHAIGDGAVRLVLDLFHRHRRKAKGLPSPGFRLEHVQLAHPDDVGRMACLDLAVSVQPLHQAYDAPLIDRHLGPRASIAYPFASLSRAGIPLLFGSDAPVADADPLMAIWAAVHRPAHHPDHGPGGTIPSWRPEERLPLPVALASASATGHATLRKGDPADLVILDRAPADVAPDAIRELRVLGTLHDGRLSHAASDGPDLACIPPFAAAPGR